MVHTLRGTQYLPYAAQRPERIYTGGLQCRPTPLRGGASVQTKLIDSHRRSWTSNSYHEVLACLLWESLGKSRLSYNLHE